MIKSKPLNRFSKIMLSLGTSTILKCITFICSFILTRLIIKYYGSEINGMINSIMQFLGFITLLEAGIGGVARAVLFKPLAEKNELQICKIITYLERFFRILSFVFVLYSICLAFIFPTFATEYDFIFTLTLVLILAISSFCEYFFGITYSILLSSDQKSYFINSVSFLSTILNFAICVALILFGANIQIVKLASAGIMIIKPILLHFYCKKKYNLKKVKAEANENLIPQKWSGFGVHVAYYLHRNTDIFLITIFLSFSAVSVYSVYNMIISGVLTLATALCAGFEAALGNIYSNGEIENLKSRFKNYVFYYQFVTTFLLSSTLILILPFIRIYTSGITDADYNQPLFAVLFVCAEFLYCLRVPFNDLMVATNSFKEIRFGAYIEAGINIVVSLSLVLFIGLIGVAIGTICAMLFRLIHFLWFFKIKKIHLNVGWFIKNSLVSCVTLVFSFFVSKFLNVQAGNSFLSWTIYALIICTFNILFIILFNALFNKKEFLHMMSYIKRKFSFTR